MTLDLAQYSADDGPCVAACRDGQPHSIVVMGEEAAYAGFTAAASAHNVRSSLSLPLAGTARASALNLYASSTSAFQTSHARSVAELLARCVTALLPAAGKAGTANDPGALDLVSANAAHTLVVRARQVLQHRRGLGPGRPFID